MKDVLTPVGFKRMGDVYCHFKRTQNMPVTVIEKTVPQFESVLGTQLHIERRQREMMTIVLLKRNLIENSTLVKVIEYFENLAIIQARRACSLLRQSLY